jgi:tRNA-dihydrouridine synthase
MNTHIDLPKPFFVLAPMDDVTDTVFRQVVQSTAAPDLFFTEFVNVDGLQSPGRPKLLKKLRFAPTETRLVAQLWGKDPENFRKTAEQIADGTFAKELGLPVGSNFVGIDLNMGCPAKSEVKNGTCSALILDRPLASAIIKATQAGAGGRMPISVKTRLGWGEIDHTWAEFILGHNLYMLTMHGRTKKEMSKVPAHWDEIGKVREIRDKVAPQTLLVGNGDVMSHQQGVELATEYGLDGIMIGRGIFHDPYIFSEDSQWVHVDREARIELYKRHVTMFAETWQQNERPIHTLNKFCKVYINGFDGAKELREQLMQADSTTELLSLLHSARTDVLSSR